MLKYKSKKPRIIILSYLQCQIWYSKHCKTSWEYHCHSILQGGQYISESKCQRNGLLQSFSYIPFFPQMFLLKSGFADKHGSREQAKEVRQNFTYVDFQVFGVVRAWSGQQRLARDEDKDRDSSYMLFILKMMKSHWRCFESRVNPWSLIHFK